MTEFIDGRRFREVLGQYPTGVSVVTSISPEGTPIGMAVGSFSSVSLDPPLVAFMPDRSSTTWPKIQARGSFCVNVLAADQEAVCRAFAGKGDKFSGLDWLPAATGSPILRGAVAWVDCDIEHVFEAGDHFIVIGRVRNLDIAKPELPLLFFRGGYGSFIPLSFTVVEEELLHYMRDVDQIRPHMENVARELGLECNAAVVVGQEFIYVARAGSAVHGDVPTRVGRRLPFRPPVGIPLAANGEPELVEAWLDRLSIMSSTATREAWRDVCDRVRERGYSVGLGMDTHAALWERLTAIATAPGQSNDEVDRIIDSLRASYEQQPLQKGRTYDVRTISVPVFNRLGDAAFQLTLYGLPAQSEAQRIEEYADSLKAAAADASAALGLEALAI